MRICYLAFIFMLTLFTSTLLSSQQVADSSYSPEILIKAYPTDDGTTIHIDRGHGNFHTRSNRFLPFATVLAKDGYQVVDYDGSFDKEELKGVKILVISNALSQNARSPFVIPTESAFTTEEITNVNQWVKEGGSLFLIADHMPFAGASATLAKAFGFDFYDSFVFDGEDQGIFDFTRENAMLAEANITNGRNSSEKVNHVTTFTGQAFKAPNDATSILSLTEEHVVLLPDTMWVFNNATRELTGKNLSQGAYMNYNKGRVVVFGEAAMFTGQLAGPDRIKVGMNAIEADENYKLLLNIIHWLDLLY